MPKSSKIYFNKETEKALRNKLNVIHLNEVLNKKYKKKTLSGSELRKKSEQYKDRIRGSVRLKSGRYYTQEEFEKRVSKSLSKKLP